MSDSSFLLDIWSVRKDGTRVHPYRIERGDKAGLFDVSWSGKTDEFEGVAEAELVRRLLTGAFSNRGTVRMLPLNAKPGEQRNAFLPEFYKGLRIRDARPGELTKLGAPDQFEIGYQAIKGRFLAALHGFHTFASNQEFDERERRYKDELVQRYSSTVAAELTARRYESAGKAAIDLLTFPLQHAGRKPQNIVGWRYIDTLRQVTRDSLAAFGALLSELTPRGSEVESSVDKFVRGLIALAEPERVLPAAQRSITGFYLAVSDPSRHIFLKTEEMRTSLAALDPSFSWDSKQLSGLDVVRVEALARKVFQRLTADGFEPRDMIDVQGFLWVGTTYPSADSTVAPTPQPQTPGPNVMSVPLNQILFGPPGTGKTHESVVKALEIIDPVFLGTFDPRKDRAVLKERFDALVAEGRIDFVTFHQSFSYEDFIEGIQAETVADGLRYHIRPGLLKRMCESASGSNKIRADVGISDDARIWKVSIDSTGHSPTRDYCFSHGEARIGWGETGNLLDPGLANVPYFKTLSRHSQDTLGQFSREVQPGDVVLCIASRESIQAVGVATESYRFDDEVPTGIISDYNHVIPVHWLATGLDINLRALNADIGFTLKTVYELKRIRWPALLRVLEEAGVSLSPETEPATDLPYVMIIDEINRGNISRIFGEAISLLEDSKRRGAAEALEVTLPYSQERFSIPRNLYLVGTMNTADRSLTGLDIALRRRFTFVEMQPNPKVLERIEIHGVNVGELLALMNRRIERLLDRDHRIGHAYFMQLRSDDIDGLGRLFKNRIIPLLQEYFFEDWRRIAWVLNDHRKLRDDRFLIEADETDENLFGDEVDAPTGTTAWRINEEAFSRPAAYRGVFTVSRAE